MRSENGNGDVGSRTYRASPGSKSCGGRSTFPAGMSKTCWGRWERSSMRTVCASVAVLVVALVAPAKTAVGVEPASPPTTLLNYLGIPQGIDRVRDATVNRNGNFPGLERKDPLRPIGDPVNLASDNRPSRPRPRSRSIRTSPNRRSKASNIWPAWAVGVIPAWPRLYWPCWTIVPKRFVMKRPSRFAKRRAARAAFVARPVAAPKSCRSCTRWLTERTNGVARRSPLRGCVPRLASR